MRSLPPLSGGYLAPRTVICWAIATLIGGFAVERMNMEFQRCFAGHSRYLFRQCMRSLSMLGVFGLRLRMTSTLIFARRTDNFVAVVTPLPVIVRRLG